jgi:hypothetical protein
MSFARRYLSRESAIAAACVLFLAWFSMKFYMDNSHDSETDAYVSMLLAAMARPAVAVDGAGNYTLLAPLPVWPFAVVLQHVSGAFQIRSFVFAHFLLSLVVYGAAYSWYRRLGLRWLTSLLGLVLVSTSFAFALLLRGWELDKIIEPALFLLAALAAWESQYLVMLGLAVLAVVNRESGALMPLLALAAVAREEGLRAGLLRWPFWASLLVCAIGVVFLRAISPPPELGPATVLPINLKLDRLVYVLGGFCLLPLLASAWVGAAAPALQRLFLLLAPIWLIVAVSTDRLEQGATLLTPLTLLCVPVALAAIDGVRRPATRSG